MDNHAGTGLTISKKFQRLQRELRNTPIFSVKRAATWAEDVGVEAGER
jgi:hypothetical protein